MCQKKVSIAIFSVGLALLGAACEGKTGPAPGPRESACVVAPSGLRLRGQPGMDAARLALIPMGACVDVLERSDTKLTVDGIESTWVKVRHEGVEGWVFGGFLGSAGDSAVAAREEDVSQRAAGDWLGQNECEGERSHLKLESDRSFSGRLFGGCGVEGCQCAGLSGRWTARNDRLCLNVEQSTAEVVRGDGEICFFLKNERLVHTGKTALVENFGSEVFTNLARAAAAP